MSTPLVFPPNTRPLLLLRHGEARQDLPVRDRERPLAATGRQDILRIAHRLQEHGLVPGLILFSPARRTRETAELFRETVANSAEYTAVEELYHGHADEYLRVLRDLELPTGPLLLVGHNPAISDLLFHLCPRAGDSVSSLPTGAVAVLGLNGGARPLLGADSARCIGLLLPRDREAQ